jgi:hypothetical protein
LPDKPIDACVYSTYQPQWTGALAGYNVTIDLGIFLGEYLIAKRPRLFWDIYRGHAIEPATYDSDGYLRPHLSGMPRGWACDVLRLSLGAVAHSRQNSKIGRDRMFIEKDVLIRVARGELYASRLPDGDSPIIFGDSKNEPI